MESNENIESPIYPLMKVIREKNTLILRTTLRKKHRGKWYLWDFSRDAYVPEGRTDFSAALSSFHRDIYLCMLKGKVDTKAVFRDGTKVYTLDNDQRSEEERMKPIF